MSQKSSHFECRVIKTYYFSDIGIMDAQRNESRLIVTENLSDLYEKLGEAKSRETPPEDRGDDYIEVDFGPIREIIVVSETVVDEETLRETPAYQQWERDRKEAAIRKQKSAIKKQQALVALAAEKQAREIAELKRLQAKYPITEGGEA